MAGTLTISTLSDGTNSTSSTNCIQGSAKAWVQFDGTVATPTIRAQYNVSSVVKNSTGDYTVNFFNAMPDANYGWALGIGYTAGGVVAKERDGILPTTTQFRFAVYNTSWAAVDQAYVCASIFR